MTIAFSCHCTFYIFAGDLNERIGARLHDLSQLQLESGKRSHLSRANISKSSRLVSALKEKQKLIENKSRLFAFNSNKWSYYTIFTAAYMQTEAITQIMDQVEEGLAMISELVQMLALCTRILILNHMIHRHYLFQHLQIFAIVKVSMLLRYQANLTYLTRHYII